MIWLDTNVVIELLNRRLPKVRQRFDDAARAGTAIKVSSIVYHELMYGAAVSDRRRQGEDKIALLLSAGVIDVVPWDADDGAEAADIRADLKRQGKPIGPFDVLIAGQARRSRCALVTANVRELDRVTGLTVIDWSV